jgi:ATP phosphoribosyltransferase regulatory subunit
MQLDFSVASDMGYYNGIVFRGFLRGLPCGVLSGGRYDKLVRKMGKSFGAIGFAITLNELERLTAQAADYDADVLLLYDENSDLPEVARRSRALSEEGKRVLTQPRQNAALRVRETVDMRGGAANGGT